MKTTTPALVLAPATAVALRDVIVSGGNASAIYSVMNTHGLRRYSIVTVLSALAKVTYL